MSDQKNIRVNSRRVSKKGQQSFKPYTSTFKHIKVQIDRSEPKLKIKKYRIDKIQRSKSIMTTDSYKKQYYISKGNNHTLVSTILELSDFEAVGRSENANFLWLQDNKRFQYQYKKNTTMVNMFQFHHELTDKDRLYSNMKNICLLKGLNIDEIMPVSFILDFKSPNIKHLLSEFLKYYISNHPHNNIKNRLKQSFTIQQVNFTLKIKYKQIISQINDLKDTKYHTEQTPSKHQTKSDKGIKKKSQKHIKIDHNQQCKYIWILKPSNLNRGRNIKLFSKLRQLEDLLSQSDPILAFKMYTDPHKQYQTRYVIQKYIQNPLLLHGRKFDIRVWVLIDSQMNGYFFNEGYLRLSGYPYTSTKDSLDNIFIHLTNNAVQKNSQMYGKFQQGNQLSFADFEKHLSENTNFKYPSIIQKIKQLITLSLNATIPFINEKMRRNCFQLLGYDFLMDEQGHVWLIQCNSNPCLEESSDLLSRLIPLLIKQSLKILKGQKSIINCFERLI